MRQLELVEINQVAGAFKVSEAVEYVAAASGALMGFTATMAATSLQSALKGLPVLGAAGGVLGYYAGEALYHGYLTLSELHY